MWEYKVDFSLGEDDLNELGRAGWELVAVTPETEHFGPMFYLKRRIR